jgi:hypothetical protein
MDTHSMKPAFLTFLGALALALGACSGGGSRQAATPISVDVGRTASLVSAYRAANGLGPVRVESRLNDAAASHARLMGGRDKMSHSLGGSLPKRIGAAGYDWGAAAENLGPAMPTSTRQWRGGSNPPVIAATCSTRTSPRSASPLSPRRPALSIAPTGR